ncbi:MAG: N-acetylmuramoyl-L-alanine amidase [Rickettsiales bacterium]|nr:N-acetylmuramoyl-L-alanine amidase [Rickettsiales bacterium]
MTKKFRHNKFTTINALLSCLLLCCFFLKNACAENTTSLIKEINFLPQNILEISLSSKNNFKSFTLTNPDRLVIDIENAAFEKKDYSPTLPEFISSFRSRVDEKKSLRLVFDLKRALKIKQSSFQNSKITIEFDITPAKYVDPANAIKFKKEIPKKIIVIDAGHGGKDPGTIGDYARTKEKNITLSYAKELKKYLDNTKKYQVFLTRDKDFFIPLKKRVEKARRMKADLFISLHANSINDDVTSGLSIYTLSEKSSDKQAELLARKENRADIISGADFSTESPDVMKTLIDLSQRDSMNKSSIFANIAIMSVKDSEIKILQNTHRFAGFAVLTAPDMASVLIELGYLSNRNEEKNLNNLIYKRKVAQSLTEAIDKYFAAVKG